MNTPIFLEAVLAIEIMWEPQCSLEEKVNPSIFNDELSQVKNRPIYFHITSTSVIRQVKQNQLSFSSSEANYSSCQRSDAWSHLMKRVVSSA